MAIKRSSQRSRSHRKGSTIVCRIREEEGGFDKTNICQGRLSHNLPIQSKLNILQWMKFSMCKRGLCTHWLIWLFRKWVGIETMKLWVQWLQREGSYQSILLLFGRSLDVSCLIHGYYTYVSCLIRTVTIHTIVEAAVSYTVTIHTSHVLYRRLLYILLLKLPARLWSPPRLNDCAANATVRDRFDIEKFLVWVQKKKKLPPFNRTCVWEGTWVFSKPFLWGFFGVMCFILLGQNIYALSKSYKFYKNLAQQCCKSYILSGFHPNIESTFIQSLIYICSLDNTKMRYQKQELVFLLIC